MDNLLELLIPAIFIVGSLILNATKGKKEEEEQKTEPIPGQEFRDLKDEIKRRIEEAKKPAQPTAETEVERPRTQTAEFPRISRSQSEPRPVYEERPMESPSSYDRIEALKKEVELKRKAAEQEREKANAVMQQGRSSRSAESRPVIAANRGIANEVISELKYPRSAKKAILNAEILGQPVGLKKRGYQFPSA